MATVLLLALCASQWGWGSGCANAAISAEAAGTSFAAGRGRQWEAAMRNLVRAHVCTCDTLTCLSVCMPILFIN